MKALAVVVALAGSARADTCKDDRQKLATFFKDVDKLGSARTSSCASPG